MIAALYTKPAPSLNADSWLLALVLGCLLNLSVPLAAAAATPPASAPATELVQALQRHYAQLAGFKADFTQTLMHQESGTSETRKGSLLFQKPLRIRWETRKPDPELLLVTEKEIWNYLPEDEVATRYTPELVQDSRSVIQVVTGQSRLDQDFSVKEEGRDGNIAALHLYPHEPTPQLTEAMLWVDVRTKMIQKALVIDFYGNRNEIVFSAIQQNPTFPADTFVFAPPAGVTVENRMNGEVPQNSLLQ